MKYLLNKNHPNTAFFLARDVHVAAVSFDRCPVGFSSIRGLNKVGKSLLLWVSLKQGCGTGKNWIRFRFQPLIWIRLWFRFWLWFRFRVIKKLFKPHFLSIFSQKNVIGYKKNPRIWHITHKYKLCLVKNAPEKSFWQRKMQKRLFSQSRFFACFFSNNFFREHFLIGKVDIFGFHVKFCVCWYPKSAH